MDVKHKKILTNLIIILFPILLIRYALGVGAVSTEELDLWNTAIAIGAMISVLIYLFRNKKG